MVYKVTKKDYGFVVTDKESEERIFESEIDLAMFLAGWAVKGMKEGEDKLVTDVEIVNAMI